MLDDHHCICTKKQMSLTGVISMITADTGACALGLKIIKKKVATHVLCCLKLRSFVWLVKENIRRGKITRQTFSRCALNDYFLVKKGLGQRCTGTEVVDTYSEQIHISVLSQL